MNARDGIAVVIAAGGLGTRVGGWSPFLPKEFRPVGDRPGLVHVLEEAAASGADRAVVVHHRYYAALIDWTRQIIAPGAQARYQQVARQPVSRRPPTEHLRVDFIPQRGRYADLTSALNGAEHLRTGDLCLVFADNVDIQHSALSSLVASVTPGVPTILAGHFDLDAASSHGVIICTGAGPVRVMAGLVEKPDSAHARHLADQFGPDNLRLLQGRVHLTPGLLHYLSAFSRHAVAEPKLSLALAAYARQHRVDVVTNNGSMIDLGAPAASTRPIGESCPPRPQPGKASTPARHATPSRSDAE